MAYAYSTDEEHFYSAAGDTREDALEEGIDSNDLEPGRTIWTGEIDREQAATFAPDADDLIDTMMNRAYEDSGEWAEDWLMTVTPEQKAELTTSIKSIVNEWADKHGHQPKFFHVVNIEAHKVPDLAPREPEEEPSVTEPAQDVGDN